MLNGWVSCREPQCLTMSAQLVTEITRLLELPVPPYQVSVERCGAPHRSGTATDAATRASGTSQRVPPHAAPEVPIISGSCLFLQLHAGGGLCTRLVTIASVLTL